ncbi:MAG: hypothetical protein ACOY4R_16565 [Pseudomonadota bacterium]
MTNTPATDPVLILSDSRAVEGPPPPRRRTTARLQTHFLRRFALSGSVAEAAARIGVATRTVQRWRAGNPVFARRYEAVLANRLEILEDLAMRRALGTDRRPVFHRGRHVATVERHNDAMLMRLLARFDRLRAREDARTAADEAHREPQWLRELEAATERNRQDAAERAAAARAAAAEAE